LQVWAKLFLGIAYIGTRLSWPEEGHWRGVENRARHGKLDRF
jgi:hypothetical protein